MSDNPAWKGVATEYCRVNEEIKGLEEIKEGYRKELLRLCADQNCLGGGVKVMKTVMRGRVDYEAIPEIKGINLDKYRKSSTTSWKILTV